MTQVRMFLLRWKCGCESNRYEDAKERDQQRASEFIDIGFERT